MTTTRIYGVSNIIGNAFAINRLPLPGAAAAAALCRAPAAAAVVGRRRLHLAARGGRLVAAGVVERERGRVAGI